jgi:STE24 endopeptidase
MKIIDIIGLILILGFVIERLLNYLNMKHGTDELPDRLSDIYDLSASKKSRVYEQENYQFNLVTESFNLILMLVLIYTGAFGKIDAHVLSITDSPVIAALLFFGIVAVGFDLINTPFSIYKIFVIENKFGFNKTTPATFIIDKIKGYLLGAMLGGSLVAMFVMIYQLSGAAFWIYAWIVVSIFLLLISMFYASVILPFFNKLTPLPEGELRNAITDYSKKTGFGLKDIFVMDGSKRSSKANAFFSGIGSQKKIILFDTLIDKHTTSELVAILAHEIGHYKKKHTRNSLILSILQMGIMLYIFTFFIENPSISAALGGESHTIELGILAFGLLYSPVSMIVSLLMNALSRKNEFEADRFAAETFNGSALQQALKKLSVDHLSKPDPHPAYVFFYYSHPPLIQRLKSLDKFSQTA